jgi:hypothetical protein
MALMSAEYCVSSGTNIEPVMRQVIRVDPRHPRQRSQLERIAAPQSVAHAGAEARLR